MIHCESLIDYMRADYAAEDIARLSAYLHSNQTFNFVRLKNGLFPASGGNGDNLGGYENAWLRDNVHIAYAHYVWGERDVAVANAQALMRFMCSQRLRMNEIISRPSLAKNPMNRPHIRFDATTFIELDEHWPHAQNDALGYFLWFYCLLANTRHFSPDEESLETLGCLIQYLDAVAYWQDKDSGHWEEVLKVAASSVGAVVAGLREFLMFAKKHQCAGSVADLASRLLKRGESVLNDILPLESIDLPPGYPRDYDAALLFLIYPLNVVSSEMANQIIANVFNHLQGLSGIRRYIGDSYWCADYRELFGEGDRGVDFSENIKHRDCFIKKGEEAQWCIFDPILVCAYACRYLKEGAKSDFMQATHYFNRSLGQLYQNPKAPGALQCPEAYFLEKGQFVPNDQLPLQWTQANLKMAFHWMAEASRGGR